MSCDGYKGIVVQIIASISLRYFAESVPRHVGSGAHNARFLPNFSYLCFFAGTPAPPFGGWAEAMAASPAVVSRDDGRLVFHRLLVGRYLSCGAPARSRSLARFVLKFADTSQRSDM
jgi:hypothetical protein